MASQLEGKVVIVTGGNTGIGLATSMELAALGAIVIIASRTESTSEAACEEISFQTGNEKVFYRHLDLAFFPSIKKFATEIQKEYKHIDILVNNAAVMGVPLPALTEDGIEVTFGVNHLGHFYLTQLLLETLLQSRARVINVSSDGYKQAKPAEFTTELFTGDKPVISQQDEKDGMPDQFRKYAYSKLCNIYFTKELVARNPELLAVSLHPGIIRSELGRHWKEQIMGKLCMTFFSCFLRSPEVGCKTTIHCCKADISGVNGLYFKAEKEEKLEPIAEDGDIQLALWECSERLVKQLDKSEKGFF